MSGPEPPADLSTRIVHPLRLDTGTILHRFYTRLDGVAVRDPIHYDRSHLGRFNAPDGNYGVLYAACHARGAFAETFLRRSGRRIIDSALMSRKAYVRLRVMRPLTLIEFDGRWLAPLGATAAVPHSDPPYDTAQLWSRALRQHPVSPDGIAYTSRHDPSELCYALFDPRRPCIEEIDRQEALDAVWFWSLADHYSLGLAPEIPSRFL